MWVNDKDGIKNVIVNYFKDLFSNTSTIGFPQYWPNLFPSLDQSLLTSLNKDISPLEIKDALFSIGGLKAPGPDGYLALFLQKHLNICQNDVNSMVYQAFNTFSLPNNLNNTLIALVPKNDNPITMASLQPISPYNTIYKII